MYENGTMNLGTVSWPVAAIIIGCFALLLFRTSITRLIDRVRDIRAPGFHANAGVQDTSQSEVGPSVANEFARQHDDLILVKRKDSLCTELGLGRDHTQKENNLLGIIAAHSIALQFEKTYRTIFGSQLSALVIINSTAGGVQFRDIEHLYIQAEARHKEFYATYSREQWLEYMERELLIIRKDNKLIITPEGNAFLKYIMHQGYTLYKYG